MKRNIALLLLGILPLPLGYALNFVILSLPSSSILLSAVSIGFLLLWVLLARRVSAREGQPIVQALLLSAFGLLMLLLVFYQELVMGRYWFNLLGAAPQLYFLPPSVPGLYPLQCFDPALPAHFGDVACLPSGLAPPLCRRVRGLLLEGQRQMMETKNILPTAVPTRGRMFSFIWK